MSADQIADELNKVIGEFTLKQQYVKGQIVIAYPAGIPIATSWDEEISPILMGGLTASIKLTFQKLCEKLQKGNLKRLFVNSEYGRIIVQNAGPNAIVNTILSDEVDMSSMAFFASDIATKIEKIIGDFQY